MTYTFFIILVFSFAMAFCAYLSCENFYLFIGLLIAYLFVLFSVVAPKVSSYREKQRRSHECYRFVNTYLISLSATQSLERSLFSAMEGVSGKLLEIVEAVSGIDPLERVRYLKAYFDSPLYAMFLSVLDLYLSQGGDVLRLGASLLAELTRVEEGLRLQEKTGAKNIIQYAVLWLMSIGIMVFLRFGLGSFYQAISSGVIYQVCIAIFYLFFLISVVAYCYAYTEGAKVQKIRIKKGRKYEKA